MKKLLITTTVLSSLISSMAFAKTEGNYVGVDLLATQYKQYFGDRKDDIDLGIGANYKYAFNFGGFYVAPGAYFNYNNADITVQGSGVKDKESLKYSYGAKLDLGYDVTDKIAPFVTIAWQEAQHESEVTVLGVKNSDDFSTQAIVYGAGVKYSVTSNIDVSAAYEYVDYSSHDSDANSLNPEIIKLGAAYKF